MALKQQVTKAPSRSKADTSIKTITLMITT